MRTIIFYKFDSGECPVSDFLDSLTSKKAQKVAWVLQLVEELDVVPVTYFKKLVNTDSIWEIRVQIGNDILRLLGFLDDGNLVVLTNGFQKKTQKTPKSEIDIAESRKRDYFQRKRESK
jgi:phage-related protein